MKKIDPKIQDLIKTILALKNEKEAWNFFRDLLTQPELEEFARRWQAAKLLDKNVSYTNIEIETGLSSATVARVSRWLKKGMGGYRLMIDRQSHHSHTPPL